MLVDMVTVSLCMMCKKDDYSFLDTCLTNVAGGVDEIIIVVDKIDQEIEDMVKGFNVKLIEHEYNNSSAEQRNISIKNAKMDWILVLDADEILALDDLIELKGLVKDKDYIACVLNQINYTDDQNQVRFFKTDNDITRRFGFKGCFTVPAVRFFKNNMGLYFTRRVREMVDEVIDQKGLSNKVLNTNIPMHHLKALKRGDVLKDTEIRYLRLLEMEVADNPENFKALFDIGTINLFTLKNPERAIQNFKEALKTKTDFIEAKLNLAFAYGEIKNYEEALEIYKDILKQRVDYFTLSSISTCYFFIKKYKEAIEYLEKALAAEPERKEEIEKKIEIIKKIMG